MSPRNQTGRTSLWHWLGGLVGRRRAAKTRQGLRRRLRIEPLETRSLLATDLAAISGLVYKDVTGNGFTPGEQVVGATVNLFVDDGDGVFEPGSQDLAPTLPILPSTTTNASGKYTFNNITAASYWVQQPAQTVGGQVLAERHDLVTVTAANANGTLGRSIDTFQTPGPSITATQGVPAAAVQAGLPPLQTLGGERDLSAQMTSGGPDPIVSNVNFSAAGNQLNFNPSSDAIGRYVATWDGVDGNANSLNATGLGGVDLTEAGVNTGIVVRIRLDNNATASSQFKLRVFTNATSASERTVSNLNTAPNTVQELFIPFSSFTTTLGAGANFASVGAIELEVLPNAVAVDGIVSLVGMIGPTVKTQDFANYTPADLAVTKQVNNPTPNVGTQIQYTVTLTNNGPNQATNVVVTDQLPTGLTFVSSTPSQGTYNALTGLWSVGTVNVQANATLTIVANVTQAGVRLNTATVTAADQNDENPNNNSGSAQISTPQVDLAVLKSVDDSTPDKNQNVTFTVNLTNNGPATATGVTISDQLPAGLTFVSATPSVGTYNNGTGVWTVGTLANQASATLSIVATVIGVGTNNTITNTASLATVNETDTNQANNQDSEILSPNRVDIAVLKTVNDNTPDKNQNVTFTVTATNNGPAAATGVTLTDLLPAGLTFVSASPSGSTTYNSTTGVWTIGNLSNTAGSNSATLSIVATVVGSGPTITNTASLTTVSQFDTNPDNNSDNEVLTPNQLDLAVLKSVDDNTPDKNQNVTFTVSVTNNGPTAATGVQITDQLPAGLTFVSATPSAGTYSNTTGIWTLGALSNTAGQNTASLQIVATSTGSTPVTNTASLTAVNQFDSNSNNNQDSETVTPNVLDLAVAKTVDDSTPDKNQNVTFTVTVTNNGPVPATGVQITDQLPAGVTFVSATPSVGAYSNATGIWTLGALSNATGQNTATMQVVATVTAAPATTITNTASLTAVNQTDSNAANNTASAVLTPNQTDLAITKTVSPTVVGANKETVFTLNIQNNGPANATGVQVTDILPAGLTFVAVESATAGTSYDSTTGIWTVGNLSATSGQNTATLAIRVRATGNAPSITNTANITQSSQFDPVPNNNTSSSTVTTRILSKRLFLADTAVVSTTQ